MPDRAPSRGAWSLLQWARQYRSRFFEQVLPKALKDAEEDPEAEFVAAERKSVAEIRAILKQFEDAETGGSKHDPAADKAKAAGFVADWTEQTKAKLSRSAREALAAGIEKLLLA